MADERLYSIKLGLDATSGARNMRQFHSLFNKTLKDLGEQAPDIKAFKELAKQAETSSDVLNGVEDDMADLIRSYNKLKTEAAARDKLKFIPDKEIERQVADVRRHFATLKKSGSLSAKEIERAYAETEQQIKALRGETEKSAIKTEGALKRIARQALAVTAAFFGLRELGGVGKDILKTGDAFEKLDKQLEALTGSAEKAQEASQWIQDFTQNTPLQLEQVTEQFTKLKAFGIDPMDGSLQKLVDANERLGGGMDRLNGIVLAFGQAWAKQKLQGEELLQLVERGIPVWETLEKITGKNTTELQKMSSAGELGRDTIKALMDELGKQSASAAAANMTLLSGYVSNLKDEWQLFLKEVADAGVLDYAKDNLKALLTTITELKENGQLQKYAQGISRAMISVSETTKAVIGWIVRFKDEILFLGSVLASAKVLGAIGAVTSRLGDMSLRLKQVQADSAITGKRISALGLLLRAIPAAVPITIALVGMKAASAGIDQLMRKLSGYDASLRQLAASEEQFKNHMLDMAATFRQQAEALESARDIEYKSSEQLLQLSEQERQSYADRIAAIQEYLALKVRQAQAQQSAGVALDAETKRAVELYNGQKEALAQLTAAQEYAAKAMQSGLTVAAQQAKDRFTELQNQGISTADALKSVGGALDLSRMADLRTFNALLKEIETSGTQMSKELRDAFGDIVGDIDVDRLTQLRTVIDATFDSADEKARTLNAVITHGLADELARLGLSFEELQTGIDASGTQAVKDFQAVKIAIAETGTEANIAEQKILEAFAAAASNTSDPEALKQLRAELKAAGDEGLVSGTKIRDALKTMDDGARASGESVKTTTQTASDGLKAVANEAEHTEQALEQSGSAAASYAQLIADLLNHTTSELSALSRETENMFRGAMGLDVEPILDDIDQLKTGIEDARAAAIQGQLDMLTTLDMSGLSKYTAQIDIARAQAVQAFNEQKLAYLQLQDAINNGDLSGNALVKAAETAVNRFNLLNSTDLKNLERSIASARREMDSLNDSAANTLGNLQDELDRLKGNTDAIEQRQYQQKKAELEAAIAEATANNNTDAANSYRDALQVLEQIRNERQQQQREEANSKKRQAEQEQNSLERTPSAAGKSSPSTPGQSVELRLPNGQSANLSGSPADVEALLDFLANAQLSTTE